MTQFRQFSHQYPTLSPRSGRNLVETADSCATEAEDGAFHGVEPGDPRRHLARDRHLDTVNAVHPLAHPPPGGCHGRLVALVRHRGVLACAWLRPAALGHRVNAHGEGHHQQPPCQPAGLCNTQRGATQPGVFATATAAVDGCLALVGRHALGIAPRAGSESGAKDNARLDWLVVPHHLLRRSDSSLDWPCGGLQGSLWGGTALAGIPLGGQQRGGGALVRRPALGPGRERIPGDFGCLQAWGLSGTEWRREGRRFPRPGFGARRLGARTRGV